MVGSDNWDRNLPKLLKIHVYFFVLIVNVGSVAVNIQILQEQVISLESILLFGINSENQVNPIM